MSYDLQIQLRQDRSSRAIQARTCTLHLTRSYQESGISTGFHRICTIAGCLLALRGSDPLHHKASRAESGHVDCIIGYVMQYIKLLLLFWSILFWKGFAAALAAQLFEQALLHGSKIRQIHLQTHFHIPQRLGYTICLSSGAWE